MSFSKAKRLFFSKPMAREKIHYRGGRGVSSGREMLAIRLFSGAENDDTGSENTYLWDIKAE